MGVTDSKRVATPFKVSKYVKYTAEHVYWKFYLYKKANSLFVRLNTLGPITYRP